MPQWSQSGVGRYIAAERDVTIYPHEYRFDATRRATVYAHSLNQDATEILNPAQIQATAAACADLGHPVVSGDLGGAAGWGSTTTQSRYGSLVTFAQGSTVKGKADKILALAFSMGALAFLNWVRANAASVAAAALVCPVVDVVYEHDNNVGGFAASIETALGIVGTYSGNGAVTPFDPMQNTAFYATGPPLHVWRSSNDTTAVTARQDAFISAVGCAWTDMGAVGHSASAVNASDVAAFLHQFA